MNHTKGKANIGLSLPLENLWKVLPFGEDAQLQVRMPKRPCLWNRIWMRLFFGWKFESVDE